QWAAMALRVSGGVVGDQEIGRCGWVQGGEQPWSSQGSEAVQKKPLGIRDIFANAQRAAGAPSGT
ncbi:hypothetical protein, partial [Actinomadura rubrobrunea]|uniref:hypothetical protein n=1 Tax=Actinomadura rubrobrunea TaxID=115335 RepID=UPI002553BC6A